MKTSVVVAIFTAIFLFLSIFLISITSGNPIPVYPDPNPITHGPGSTGGFNIVWLLLIFVIDFFLDLLILYGTLILFDKINLLDMMEIFGFKTRRILLSAFIVSIIGLLSEVLLGTWIGGLLIVLVAIFVSFTLVTYYILKFDKKISIRLGLIAVVINIVMWVVIFSI